MNTNKLTKGYIKNTSTSKVMSFMYNPSTISISRSTNFAEINSPGSSYPTFQYVNGQAKDIGFKLFLAGNKDTVKSWIDYLEAFQPSEVFNSSLAPPSTMIFSFGTLVKECILTDLVWDYQLFDSDLNPTMVEVELKLKVV